MAVTTLTEVRCPRCRGEGVRELNLLPGEGHAIFVCEVCKHTWCEEGRTGR